MGAPKKYLFDDEHITKICEIIAETSLGLRELHIKHPDIFPSRSIINAELARNKDFSDRYARAKQLQADFMAEEILAIADDGSNDYMTVVIGDQSYEKENKELTRRSELRVDARKWLMAKLYPKKYGDKLELDNKHSGEVSVQQITGMNVQ